MNMFTMLKLAGIIAAQGRTEKTAKILVNEVWALAGISKEKMQHQVQSCPPEMVDEFFVRNTTAFREMKESFNEFVQLDPTFGQLVKTELDRQFIEVFGRPIP